MKKPKELESRHEKKLIISLKSFNMERLVEVQEGIKHKIEEMIKFEEETINNKNKCVWIDWHMETK